MELVCPANDHNRSSVVPSADDHEAASHQQSAVDDDCSEYLGQQRMGLDFPAKFAHNNAADDFESMAEYAKRAHHSGANFYSSNHPNHVHNFEFLYSAHDNAAIFYSSKSENDCLETPNGSGDSKLPVAPACNSNESFAFYGANNQEIHGSTDLPIGTNNHEIDRHGSANCATINASQCEELNGEKPRDVIR